MREASRTERRQTHKNYRLDLRDLHLLSVWSVQPYNARANLRGGQGVALAAVGRPAAPSGSATG